MSTNPSDRAIPDAWPVYAKKAKIEGGVALYRRLPDGTKIETVADIARCHPNTVRTAIDGRSVQYVKAHGVFTALNVISKNAFSRQNHVLYYETQQSDAATDPALGDCRVLYRASELQRRSGLKAEAIAAKAKLTYLEATAVLTSGKPVPFAIVQAVFDLFQELDTSLVAQDEIVN